ncbi:DUF397 domain-containing protein [Actinacidiphila acididurans]|uniref:DUF397 domain-containing protein n=1 Tax=Actinacidiphila acididurans TaxID=2784346 RepID=A0ABS2TZW4_9ACTN|nr:DUF397 domain-containing protein [Actinacidiphila acididurans]MBM9507830.1 DUF397 domain-containing protein [Actinacidiphila acididurans]
MTNPELAWFKSSYSGSSGDNCIEVAVSWHKSSYSSGQGDNCVEVASTPGTIHVRDSKDKEGPQLAFSPAQWASFVEFASAI